MVFTERQRPVFCIAWKRGQLCSSKNHRTIRSDNGWLEQYDVDATENEAYEAYLIDGLNDRTSFDFSILNNICDEDVNLKRRGVVPRKLKKGTPFILTSNLSPKNLLGELGARILAARGFCKGVTLFHTPNCGLKINRIISYNRSSSR